MKGTWKLGARLINYSKLEKNIYFRIKRQFSLREEINTEQNKPGKVFLLNTGSFLVGLLCKYL